MVIYLSMRSLLLIASLLTLLTCERRPADAQTAHEPQCSEPFPNDDYTAVQYLCDGHLITSIGPAGPAGARGSNGSPGQTGPQGPAGGGGTSRSKVITCKFELSTSPAQVITATFIRYSDGFLDINASLFNITTAQLSVNSLGFVAEDTNLALDLSPFLIRFAQGSVGVTARSTGFTQTFNSCTIP